MNLFGWYNLPIRPGKKAHGSNPEPKFTQPTRSSFGVRTSCQVIPIPWYQKLLQLDKHVTLFEYDLFYLFSFLQKQTNK